MKSKVNYIEHLEQVYPELKNENLNELISENLISPFELPLKSTIVAKAQEFIRLISAMRESQTYLDLHANLLADKGIKDPGNKSIMMSYDFHVDENDNLKLIEVNTNASFLIMGLELYLQKNITPVVADFHREEIKSMILNELALQKKTVSDKIQISITDSEPENQRLYIEFLIYRELFKKFGWQAQIQDYQQLFKETQPDFIYNRYTDFFLTEDSSKTLREKFLNQEVCLSPNPFEYLLLADKQRMIDWKQPGFLEQFNFSPAELELLKVTIPDCGDLVSSNADEIWSQRKKYFLKPKNAFGSKQSYRGGSISRVAFEACIDQNFIVQEFIPAPEITFDNAGEPIKFKYDLRCYAYQGRMQLIMGRLYQGQVTNLRTPLGGFTTIKVIP